MTKHVAGIVTMIVLSAVWSGAQAPAAPKPSPGGMSWSGIRTFRRPNPAPTTAGPDCRGTRFSPRCRSSRWCSGSGRSSRIRHRLPRAEEDEIYYVLSGRGMMTVDGKSFEVDPGTAVLTRPGSSTD